MRTHTNFIVAALLLAAAILPASTAFAQPTDLIISEYVEGSSSNKAIEIYNPTSSAIDMSAGNTTCRSTATAPHSVRRAAMPR